jgi:3-oxoacyl-[acyl-carrier protein] reductase
MDLGLKGRVAIVAAASTGLGFAVAQELSREGTDVAICARTESDLLAAASNIQRANAGQVFHRVLDVTDAKAVAKFVAAVETRFGRVDICVTNSGGPPSKLFEETRNEDWKAAIDQLLMSSVFFCQRNAAAHEEEQMGAIYYHNLIRCETAG